MLGAAACASPLPSGSGAAWSPKFVPAVPSVSGEASGVVPAGLASTAGPLSLSSSGQSGPHYFGQGPAPQANAQGPAPLTAATTSPPLVRVDYVSPSAIETFDDGHGGCMRKWAWSKLDRLPKTENKAALLGTETHGQHEDWLKLGKPYDLTKHAGHVAQATMHLLPPPGVANVEGEMSFTYRRITYGGKLDGEWLEQAGWPRLASHPPEGLIDVTPWARAVILDHKTGNKNYFKLAREQLLGHPQAPIYAARAFQKYAAELGGNPIAELRWNYATTDKSPKPFPSWHVVRPEDVHAVWDERVEQPAKRLLAVVEQANHERAQGRPFGALQLPPNWNACAAFGGCPFRSRCQPTGQQEIQAHMTQQALQAEQQNFLQRINVQPGGTQPAAPLPGLPAPAPAPTFTPPAPSAGVLPFGAQAGNPDYFADGRGGWLDRGQYTSLVQQSAPPAVVQQAPPPPAVVTSPIPAVAQASAAPAAPAVTLAQASAMAPAGVGYGPQINPPEASIPVAQVQAAQAEAAPGPAPDKPAKGKKAATAGTLYDMVLSSAVAGLCANPNAGNMSPDQIANMAKAIAAGASA